MTDSDLLHRYATARDEAAFAELVKRHLPLVYGTARRQLRDDHQAQDIAQQVFVDLARQASRLRHHPALASWLYTSTHFAAKNFLRGQWRRQARERAAAIMSETPTNEPSPADWERLRPVLDEEMHKLKAAERTALLVRFFEERPVAAVAEALGISEDAARKRIDRALERLRRRLSRHGVTSTQSALAVMLAGTGLAAPADLSRQVATRALAAHSAGAGGGLFHIMTIKSVVGGTAAVAAAALLGLAGAGAAFYGVRSAHVADEALQRAQRGLAAQKRVLERLPAMTAGRTAEINGAQTPPAAAANDNSVREAPATLAVGSQPRGDPHRDAQIFLTQYPEAKAMLLKIAKAQIASNYSPYFAQAGLSAAQVEDFENATAQLWVDTEQLSPTTFGPSVTSLPPDQARAILGEDGYTQFQNFQANSGAMGLAAMVAARVGYTAQPLSSGQTAALEELFKNAGGASDWNAIAAQAQTILSADQWTAAEGVFADQQLAQEVAGAPKTY